MEILAMIISAAIGLGFSMIGFKWQSAIKENKALKAQMEAEKKEKAQEAKDKEKAYKNAILCLLRTELIKIYDKCIDRDYITASEYENGMSMYHAYKDLGGNGLIEHMKDEIEELNLKAKVIK